MPRFRRLPARFSSVPRARRVIGDALPGAVLARLVGGLALRASEHVTHAVRGGCEGGGRAEPVLWPADGHSWVAVSGAGTGAACPAAARPRPDAE